MNPVVTLLTAHLRDLRAQIADALGRADSIERQIEKLSEQLARPAPAAVPTNRSKLDGWSGEEDAVLRANYPLVGAPGCAQLLPHRTEMAIRVRASRHLRLRRGSGPGVTKAWCKQCDRRVSPHEAEMCGSPFCKAKEAAA